jgi:hypothetical protein
MPAAVIVMFHEKVLTVLAVQRCDCCKEICVIKLNVLNILFHS